MTSIDDYAELQAILDTFTSYKLFFNNKRLTGIYIERFKSNMVDFFNYGGGYLSHEVDVTTKKLSIVSRMNISMEQYDTFMLNLSNRIRETNTRIETLERDVKVSQLLYDDWVRFQNGDLIIND